MTQPRVISTLAEAAKWMTESTGIEWTSESLLDFIYREMRSAFSKEMRKREYAVESYEEVQEHVAGLDVSCLTIALPPTTRVLERYSDETGGMQQELYGRGDTPLLFLDVCEHVFALLAHGAIELPYPLTSEPWDGAGGYWIDADTALIITPGSLRIYAHNLLHLADIFNEQNKLDAPLTSIDVLDLTNRSKNCLEAMNIRSIDELVKHSGNDLLMAPNFGRKSINEIRGKLALRGLRLLDEWQSIEAILGRPQHRT